MTRELVVALIGPRNTPSSRRSPTTPYEMMSISASLGIPWTEELGRHSSITMRLGVSCGARMTLAATFEGGGTAVHSRDSLRALEGNRQVPSLSGGYAVTSQPRTVHIRNFRSDRYRLTEDLAVTIEEMSGQVVASSYDTDQYGYGPTAESRDRAFVRGLGGLLRPPSGGSRSAERSPRIPPAVSRLGAHFAMITFQEARKIAEKLGLMPRVGRRKENFYKYVHEGVTVLTTAVPHGRGEFHLERRFRDQLAISAGQLQAAKKCPFGPQEFKKHLAEIGLISEDSPAEAGSE